MSIPRRIYNLYRQASSSRLVKNHDLSAESLKEFETIINSAQPINESESEQRSLLWAMYQSNQSSMYSYLSNIRNRAAALILWTESKRIIRFFNLKGLVHISWNKTEGYSVSLYNKPDNKVVEPELVELNVEPEVEQNTEQNTEQQNDWADVLVTPRKVPVSYADAVNQ